MHTVGPVWRGGEQNEDQLLQDAYLNSLRLVAANSYTSVAFPAISPFYVMTDYNPIVEDEVLTKLGELTEDNTAIFLTLTVPSDITKMTTNLKAPIIINADTKKGCQVIAENPEYVVKYNIYDVIQKMKENKEV